ncbi:hypothetical protein [Nonomuraea typhae]|uniref:hypothetical protein n=1 Tax=Nonomuraea typhae TaxID=2603600 RepID=UPI001FE8584C|nr:hypothetical protein [Nonomuraea typhae]
MTTRRDLTLIQVNDETVDLAITQHDSGAAQDLTGATVECYLKPTAQTADDGAGVTKLSTATGEITITSAVGGTCQIAVPAAALTTAGTRWWRADVILSGKRRTCVYGPLHVVDA